MKPAISKALRALADRIDGGHTPLVVIESSPGRAAIHFERTRNGPLVAVASPGDTVLLNFGEYVDDKTLERFVSAFEDFAIASGIKVAVFACDCKSFVLPSQSRPAAGSGPATQ